MPSPTSSAIGRFHEGLRDKKKDRDKPRASFRFLFFFVVLHVHVSSLILFFYTEKKRRACSKERTTHRIGEQFPSCSGVRVLDLRREPPDEWRLVLRRDLVGQGPSGFGALQLCPSVPLAGALSFRLSNHGSLTVILSSQRGVSSLKATNVKPPPMYGVTIQTSTGEVRHDEAGTESEV